MKSKNFTVALLAGLVALGLVAIAAVVIQKNAAEPQVGTVLITGSNRGIGLAFATQYAEKGWTVIATHRRDTVPDSLKLLIDKYESVTAERMNVAQHDEIEALAAKLRGTPIDVLINNAGIMGTGDPASAQTFGTLNHELFEVYMRINALGPIKVAETFLPHVQASKLKKIINISSSSGSVSHPPRNSKNVWYRASKTALNGLMVSMVPVAREAGVSVTLFEPGWTWTGKDESNRREGQHDPAEVVASMIETIDGLTLEDTGKFLTRFGEKQPW